MQPHTIPAWDTGLTQLADGVFAYTQATGGFCIANAGFITGPDGALAVDALFAPRMTEAFQAAVRKVDGTVIRRLVNTHHHIDHTLGNALFPDAAIIAQRSARDTMSRSGYNPERLIGLAPWFRDDLKDDLRLRLPEVVFDDALTLFAGGRRIELSHVGTAHTVGDVLVHLPEDRILFAGDVCFFYVTPLAFEGNIGRWIRVLQQIEAMDAVDVIVPGHGPVGGVEQVRELRAYFEAITAEAHRRFEMGLDEDAAARDIALGPWAQWGEAERIVPNVYRLYTQFRGLPEGPIDVVRAFAGMADFTVRA